MVRIFTKTRLTPAQRYDIKYVMQRFEEFYALICNFRAVHFKFSKVYKKQDKTIDMFYHCILYTCNQWELSDPDERLVDALIFGTSIVKAKDKLL